MSSAYDILANAVVEVWKNLPDGWLGFIDAIIHP
jgi:hypothetical protein